MSQVLVSKLYRDPGSTFGDTHDYAFGRTIDVTMLHVDNPDGDGLMIYLGTTSGLLFLDRTDGALVQNFTMPVPATDVRIDCTNDILDCYASVDVIGS